jgi:acetoacetyl-CoA synthetase
MDDFAVYNGKRMDLRQKMTEIANGMKETSEFKGMVALPRFKQPFDITSVPQSQTLSQFISTSTRNAPKFEKTRFSDPFLIAFSSGTTGIPKCITHAGGAILSAFKEGKLHREMTQDSVALQYTTTGWIMYFSSVMNLLFGSRVILYDGSPFQPDLTAFVKLLGDQKVTMLGTSPKWMHEMQKNGIVPKDVTDLSNLTHVSSTGMVLSDQQFEWFYDVGFPKHVHLANISGGTDLVRFIMMHATAEASANFLK